VPEPEPWSTWAGRWERFQAGYVPGREEQIETMLDDIGPADRTRPLALLDLGCGPGSIARRAVRALPAAEVVNVDVDPWLLALGRSTIADDRVAWAEADLRDADWAEALPRRRFDAVVTMTAMHWLDEPEVRRVYSELASLIVPGGRFLCADLVPPGDGSSPASRRTLENVFRWQARQTARTDREDRVAFWRAARAEPAFRRLLAARDDAVGCRRPRRFLSFDAHADALVSAGFGEVEELWRRDAAAIVAASR
jgi:SAM-dependent methyltransferase